MRGLRRSTHSAGIVDNARGGCIMKDEDVVQFKKGVGLFEGRPQDLGLA